MATLWPSCEAAGVGVLLAGDEAAEGGLAGAVGADDRELFAAGDLEVEAVEDGQIAVAFAGPLELGDRVAGGGRRGEAEVHHRIVVVELDELDLLELLDAALDLGRLGRLGAEAVDELLGLLDLALLGLCTA